MISNKKTSAKREMNTHEGVRQSRLSSKDIADSSEKNWSMGRRRTLETDAVRSFANLMEMPGARRGLGLTTGTNSLNKEVKAKNTKPRPIVPEREIVKLCNMKPSRPVDHQRIGSQSGQMQHSTIKSKSSNFQGSQAFPYKVRRLSTKLDENQSTMVKRCSTKPVDTDDSDMINSRYSAYKEFIARTKDSKALKFIRVQICKGMKANEDNIEVQANVLVSRGYPEIQEGGELMSQLLLYFRYERGRDDKGLFFRPVYLHGRRCHKRQNVFR